MVAELVVILLTLLASTLVVFGFVAAYFKHSPWSYWTWAVVSVLVMSALVSLPMWVRLANFVILLVLAVLWMRDSKEAAR